MPNPRDRPKIDYFYKTHRAKRHFCYITEIQVIKLIKNLISLIVNKI